MKDKRPTVNCLIALGSNIDPQENLPKGIHLLGQSVEIIQTSQAWQTPAVGTSGPDFLNAAVLVNTNLTAEQLRNRVLRPIETVLGRVRSADKYAPRPLDLDIVVYENRVLDPDLWTQAHVAVPAAELCPELLHPQNGLNLKQHARNLAADKRIQPIPGIL
ncbi:MAG: 2-amino-4-hydroxy-6-hydroxymethyldihydropteridine diphosphokinase [Anaerolineales bacterium]|nr:2-amino-4-hydroxy-6-hydroxymethyldihydropteridine diphosphokinase [Anaerolineales bacterium]